MEDLKRFITKYALFLMIAGAIVFFFSVIAISSLPHPGMLSPIHVQAEYHTPLRIYSTLRIVSVLVILFSAYFFVQGRTSKTK